MPEGIEKIYLSIEKDSSDMFQYDSENTDVIVVMVGGEKYIAAFFTYKNIELLRQQNYQNGEFLQGKYFWAKNMVLIDNFDKHNILEVIEHLIEEGDFNDVFEKI